jgi:hypothetical protein
MYSPQLQSQIAGWRQRAIEGTLSTEELIVAVKLIREGRVSAAYSADAAKRKKAVAAIPAANDLLSELEGL